METGPRTPARAGGLPHSRGAFAGRFGAPPALVVRAPGRVNLIGEHTDYHEGYVLPMAIDRSIVFEGRPRPDRRVRAFSVALESAVEFGLDDAAPHPVKWARYLQAAAVTLGARHPVRRGCDVLVSGDLDPGGGLSSSSALVVGFTRMLATLQGIDLEPMELARLGCEAEHRYGTTGGIMDQFVISHARPGCALFLDCRTLDSRHIPLPAGIAVVIASTGLAHDQISSPFAERRRQAEAGLAVIRACDPRVRTLRDVTPDRLEGFRRALLAADASGVLWRRCRHVSMENARVQAAVACLEGGDLAGLGQLLAASQESLREDYEVSCRELDLMVAAATAHPGCIGARLTGGGFGGCTVNLVAADAVRDFCQHVARTYARATGLEPAVYPVVAAAGVQEVSAAFPGAG